MNDEEEVFTPTITQTKPLTLRQIISQLGNKEYRSDLINRNTPAADYLIRNAKTKTIGKELTPYVESGVQMLGNAYQDTMWKARRGVLGPHALVGSHAIDTLGKIIPDIPLDKGISHIGHEVLGIDKPLADVGGHIGEILITRKLLKSGVPAAYNALNKQPWAHRYMYARGQTLRSNIDRMGKDLTSLKNLAKKGKTAYQERFSKDPSKRVINTKAQVVDSVFKRTDFQDVVSFQKRHPQLSLSKAAHELDKFKRLRQGTGPNNPTVYIPPSERIGTQKGEPLMTTTGGNLFSDEEIASSLAAPEFDQTTIDLKGKVDDRSYITEWFTRRRKKDKSRRDAYDLALSLPQTEKSSRGIKEKFAGNLLVQDVEKVAKELNVETADEGITYEFSPLDVYRYITREETLHENIIQSVTTLNDIAFPGNMQIVDAKIKQLEEENVMKPGTHDKFLKQLIRFRETSGETTFPQKQVGVGPDGKPVTVIDWSKLNQVKRKGRFQRPWSKGHIKALATIFSEGLTGADVHTNLFLEPYWSQYITDPEGAITLIKGNAANADLQDAPLYVQVLLEGKSWDLKDDFLKSVTPDSLIDTYEIEKAYLDKAESIKLEYQEVAKIMYNKLLSPGGLKNWKIDIDLNKLAKGRNVELLKSYAAAQGIKAYMEAFDKAVTSRKYRIPSGQLLSSVNLNDWWLAGKWTAGNINLKDRLDRLLVREIKKALKETNVDLIEKPMTEDEMKDLLDDSYPER